MGDKDGAGTAPQGDGKDQTPPAGQATPPADPATPPETPPAGDPPADPGKSGRTPEDEVAHWKEMSRKNEARARENQKAAQELQKLQDEGKTELQKAQDRAAAAEATALEERSERLRLISVASHNLPAEAVEFLGTGTEDEINGRADAFNGVVKKAVTNAIAELSADQLRELLTKKIGQGGSGSAGGRGNGRPAESLRPGAQPADAGNPQNPNDWFRSMVEQSQQ